ncbi:amino acid ABC transporter substrate-binding protein, PAAT family [Limimonas halophila]|uniref:Amino acid ABC transporter substrate-binding protein, PAAT family n=1 Tax=Limimonas halophila TaxID=1082479 RepID=A0A1G7RMA8_9PROT|nr:lysine/arginine/ornithine ABC transporter substrate-binding protein [Limimonas halophila]SDG11867.1 amino acid ABC transporter substrate-binding protein, PAAT family [Limimonas halophila]
MRRTIPSLLAAVAVAFGAPAALAGNYEGCPAEITIGTEGAYPPFNYIGDDGELKGFDVDIAKALCEEMGADCTFETQSWSGIIPGLNAKKYDAIIASMSITEKRDEKVDFTNRYYKTPARFIAAKDMDVEISESGLEGKTVGVQRATVSADFVKDKFGDVANIQTYDTQEEATLDLVSGRVDLVVADAVKLKEGFLASDQGQAFEFKGPGFSDPKWFGEGIGIAVREGEDTLRECFNKAIAGIREDGTYDKISQDNFGMNIYGG